MTSLANPYLFIALPPPARAGFKLIQRGGGPHCLGDYIAPGFFTQTVGLEGEGRVLISYKSFIKGPSGLDRCEKGYMRESLRKSTLGIGPLNRLLGVPLAPVTARFSI